MTGKRFEIIREVYQVYKDLTLYEISNGEHTFYVYDKPVDCSGTAQELCELLNELNNEVKSQSLVIKGYQERTEKLFNENVQLKKDVDYWKQVASQYSNELNVFEHCKKYKTECKDIHWSSD